MLVVLLRGPAHPLYTSAPRVTPSSALRRPCKRKYSPAACSGSWLGQKFPLLVFLVHLVQWCSGLIPLFPLNLPRNYFCGGELQVSLLPLCRSMHLDERRTSDSPLPRLLDILWNVSDSQISRLRLNEIGVVEVLASFLKEELLVCGCMLVMYAFWCTCVCVYGCMYTD